jgi:hypothetical protein
MFKDDNTFDLYKNVSVAVVKSVYGDENGKV